MKISIVFLSIILTLSVFLPFLVFIYNGTKNTSSTKKQIASLIKNNGLVYSVKDIWRKNFIGMSDDNKTLSYINTSSEQPVVYNIKLEDLKQCNIVRDYNKDKNGVLNLKSIDLEITFRTSANKNMILPFFNIDEDLIEDFENQRIEKWHALILKAIPTQKVIKLAS